MSDDCARAMLQLREELSARWPNRMFYSGAENMSVLSLSPELTVWCLRGAFTWNDGARVVRYPLDDVSSAAEHILARVADSRPRFHPPERPALPPADTKITAAGADLDRTARQVDEEPDEAEQLHAPEPVGAA